MTRLLPQVGVDLIILEEGSRLHAYQDQGGIWTIGVGHTGPDVFPGMVITKEGERLLLLKDLDRFCNAIERLCTGTPDKPMIPNDNEFSAMVSLAFNIGEGKGGFEGSTVHRMWNAGDKIACANGFALWNKSVINDVLQVNPGLVGRRAREAALFLTPVVIENVAQTATPMAQAVAPPPSPIASKTVITTAAAGTATAISVADQIGPAVSAVTKINDTVTGVTPTIKHLITSPVLPVVLGVIVIGLLLFVGVRYVIKARRGDIKVS